MEKEGLLEGSLNIGRLADAGRERYHCENSETYANHLDGGDMSTEIKGRELKVLHGVAAPESTAQTPGMIRKPGVDSSTARAEKIWLGHVECVPNTMGPPHNHGEAETAAYVLKGHIRVYYGEDFKEYVEAGPGDFIFVPAHFDHIEGNPYDEPAEAVLSRGPDNIVINL